MKTILGLALVAMAGSATASEIDGIGTIHTAESAQLLTFGTRDAAVYSNMPGAGESFFTSGSTPRTSMGDDFNTGISNLSISSVNVIFGNQGQLPASVVLRVSIYDTIDVNGNWSGLVGQAAYQFNNLAAGFYTSGDLAVAANLADGEGGVQFEFFSTAGARLSSGWTIGFDGSGANIGASQDVYWRDVDNNGTLVGTEARTFGGTPGSLANIAMEIKGVPTPGSLALIGMGGLLAARRRRA